jgi:hypothetical protein
LNEKIALELLAKNGISSIWMLHLKAARAYRDGYPRTAEILIKTADAAERWLRRAAVGSGQHIRSGGRPER